jgi:transcriptional regulator with XRE-family HTH domain
MENTVDVQLYIGKRVRLRRRFLGLTQAELGERVGVRFQQIQKYECADNRISADRLFVVAKALDVPITYFFEGL